MDIHFNEDQSQTNDPLFDKTFTELENLKTEEQEGCNLLDLLTDVSSPEAFSVEKQEKKYFNNESVQKQNLKQEENILDFTSFFKDEEEPKIEKIEKIEKIKKTTKPETNQPKPVINLTKPEIKQVKQEKNPNHMYQQQGFQQPTMNMKQPVFQQIPQQFAFNPYMNFYNYQQGGNVPMIPTQNMFFPQAQIMNFPKSNVMVNKKTNISENISRKRKRASAATVEIPSSPDENVIDKDDKESKRKKRLIKNRQSAQASRERKKMYVKGLEKSVSNLTNEKVNLKNKLTELEKENELLRIKLNQAMKGKEIGPLPKKRKYEHKKDEEVKKVPIPSSNSYMGMKIPFLQPVFWNNFFSGGQMEGMDKSPKVILFIALFCIALFFFPNLLNKGFSEQKKLRIANRVLLQQLNNNDKLFMKNLLPDYKGYFVDKITALQKEIGSLKTKANNTEFELATDELKSKINDILGDVKLDWKDENVEFIFPGTKKSTSPVVVNGKTIKSEEVETSRKISISKEFLTEICNQLGTEGDTDK